MDFSISDDHRAVREGVNAVVRRFDDASGWRATTTANSRAEFHRALADAGWLGITMPPEQGGAGLGVSEAVIMMHEVASHGGGTAAASSVHMNLFGPHSIVVFGTAQQRARSVPRLVQGLDKQPCGAEANAAKFLGARAGYDAALQAVLTHGGFGYAKEYHVDRMPART